MSFTKINRLIYKLFHALVGAKDERTGLSPPNSYKTCATVTDLQVNRYFIEKFLIFDILFTEDSRN